MSTDESLSRLERGQEGLESRLRRVETKLTKYLVANGGDPGNVRRPMLSGSEIIAPGYFSTIADLLDTVPDGAEGQQFVVKIDGKAVATLHTKGSAG